MGSNSSKNNEAKILQDKLKDKQIEQKNLQENQQQQQKQKEESDIQIQLLDDQVDNQLIEQKNEHEQQKYKEESNLQIQLQNNQVENQQIVQKEIKTSKQYDQSKDKTLQYNDQQYIKDPKSNQLFSDNSIVQQEQMEKKTKKPEQHFFRKALQQRVTKNKIIDDVQVNQKTLTDQMNESVNQEYNEKIIKKLEMSMNQNKIKKDDKLKEFYKEDFDIIINYQESEMKYDQKVKGLREEKEKDKIHSGRLRFKKDGENLRFELSISEIYDINKNETKEQKVEWVFMVDPLGYKYIHNKKYTLEQNRLLKEIYMGMKGRAVEGGGGGGEWLKEEWLKEEKEERSGLVERLEKGLEERRVFGQVMESHLCIKNQLRLWEGTHHNQTKKGFRGDLLKVHWAHKGGVFSKEKVSRESECCKASYRQEMVFNYDGDVYVQMCFYRVQVVLGEHQPTLLEQARLFSQESIKQAFSCITRLQTIPLVPLLSRQQSSISSTSRQINRISPSLPYSHLIKTQLPSPQLLQTLQSFHQS